MRLSSLYSNKEVNPIKGSSSIKDKDHEKDAETSLCNSKSRFTPKDIQSIVKQLSSPSMCNMETEFSI